jgi:hypothetical protein
METPETEGIPPEEQDQEDTGADSAADAAKLDQEKLDEELEDRGDE